MLAETHRFGLGRRRWERDGWLWLVGMALDDCALKISSKFLECLHLIFGYRGQLVSGDGEH